MLKIPSFYQDRLGTNTGKPHRKRCVFLQQQPEDLDVLCVNARWLSACIRRRRLLGVDR